MEGCRCWPVIQIMTLLQGYFMERQQTSLLRKGSGDGKPLLAVMCMRCMPASGVVFITGSPEWMTMGTYSWKEVGKITGRRPCISNSGLWKIFLRNWMRPANGG